MTQVRGPRRSWVLVIGLVIVLVGVAHDGDCNRLQTEPRHPTLEELPALPRWCQVNILTRQRALHRDTASASDELMRERWHWANVVGKSVFTYLHHYCNGVNRINRYYISKYSLFDEKGAEKYRASNLSRALSELRFVREYLRTKPNVLYPELLVNEAIAYRELGQFDRALEHGVEAITVDRQYGMGYVELSRTLRASGEEGEARAILELGFKMTNGDKLIQAEIESPGQTRRAVTQER